MLRRTFLPVIATLAILATADAAQAGYSGTLGLLALSSNNGTSLANATSITFTATGGGTNTAGVILGTQTGAYQTAGVAGNYTTATLNLSSLSSFYLSNSQFGTFTAEASDGMGNVSEVVTQTASFLDIYLIGTYTGLPGNTAPTESSLRISINALGPNAGLATFTLSTPPATLVPEPASVAMLGLGLAGVAGFGLRRRLAK